MGISDLYLRPPTLGELVFAAARLDDYLYLFDFEDKPDVWNLFFNRFELPHSRGNGSGLDSDLAKLICNLTDGTDYNLHFPSQEDLKEYFSYLFWRLRPETTLALGNGDCKSVAVICVAYKRMHGIPARFLQPTQNHLIFEEYDGEKWIPKEPQMARFSAPLENLGDVSILPIANPPLYEKAYARVIEIFSGKYNIRTK